MPAPVGEVSKAPGLKHAVLIGAGRMGAAMARGWLRNPSDAGIYRLSIVEPSPSDEVRQWASAGRIDLNAKASPAEIAILAVKPQGFAAAAPGVRGWIGPQTLIVSIMAGVAIHNISEKLGSQRVLRAMPNTPGAIGKGVTGYAPSGHCSDDDRASAERLLAPLGDVIGPLEEALIDVVTAVSGSGPAYVYLLAEALEAAARSSGLDPQAAAKLARKTVSGAGALLAEGGDPADLRRAVTSPGGTTAAALEILMAQGGLPDLMRKAVEAAVKRGGELSDAAGGDA